MRSAIKVIDHDRGAHRLGWACGCVTSLRRRQDGATVRRVTPCGTDGCLRGGGGDPSGMREPRRPAPPGPHLAAEVRA